MTSPSVAVHNSLKEKLAAGGLATCMSVRLVPSNDIILIAKSAGFDAVYVDLEHASFSLETVGRISTAALAANLACLVRVGHNDQISQVLDGGAVGVIVPNIRTAAAARQAVIAAKYPPGGKRGASAGLPHFGYRSVPPATAMPALDAATMVVLQIESVEGLTNIDAIAAVDGVDMLLIGTNDLLADMNLAGQFEHQRVRDAYVRAIAACRKAALPLGIGGLSARIELVAAFVEMGARFISVGSDIGFLMGAAQTRQAEFAALHRPLSSSETVGRTG
ncbi:aldolase [Microvirga brassicacearum]|uniref:Aldolase n=2 Tax=Microvirga brassicacearum TaxID=2580413 RepID=A0A5N3PAW8_9HYPH|nr:aldolase [Microvirga brassicacearum]